MIVWITLALFTTIAGLCIAWPFLSHMSEPLAHNAEAAVLKTALAATDRDEALNVLAAQDASAQRIDIASRFDMVSKKAELKGYRQTPLAAIIAVISTVIICVLTFTTYGLTGSPHAADMPLSWRLENDPDVKFAYDFKKVEERLSDNPTDGQGWAVIAPIYFEKQNWAAASNAYLNAVQYGNIEPQKSSQYLVYAAQATINHDGGNITPTALSIAKRASELDATNIYARYMNALGIETLRPTDDAKRNWSEFLSDFSQDTSGLTEMAKQRLAALTNPQQPAPLRGPSPSEIEAAASLSETDRQAMIKGMVESLAQRLNDEPDNLAGWQRLIRSYIVLDQSKEARSAYISAKQHFIEDDEATAQLETLAQSLGLKP